MAMRFTVLASAVLLSACVGQSGSEYIPPPSGNPNPGNLPGRVPPPMIPPRPHCPCDGLRGGQQVRATVLGVEDFPPFVDLRRYELRAEEILSDTQSGEASL